MASAGMRTWSLLRLVGGLLVGAGAADLALASPDTSIDTTMQVSSNLYEVGSIEHQAELDLILEPQVAISERLRLVGKVAAAQWLTGERKITLEDATVALNTRAPLSISGALGYTPSLSALVPASYASREENSLVSALGTTHRLDLTIAPALAVAYRTGLTRYFYEFTTAASGKANPQWRFLHRADLSWSISEKLKLAVAAIASIYWSHAGNPWTSFEGTQELSFQASERISLAMGHTNSGNAFKANGVDSNVSVFDSNTSTVYGGITVTF